MGGVFQVRNAAGYEVFAGNRTDVTTLQEIVQTMERRYGRGSHSGGKPTAGLGRQHRVSEAERSALHRGHAEEHAQAVRCELLAEDWRAIRDGLEVKLCPSPDGDETFVLCRSRDRREKEKAMHGRFERRIEEGLQRIATACEKQRQQPLVIAQRLGRLMGQNSRAAGLFHTEVKTLADGRASLHWEKIEQWRDWAALSEGCYLLRSNVTDWSDEEFGKRTSN